MCSCASSLSVGISRVIFSFSFWLRGFVVPQGCVLPWIGVISESFFQASILKHYFLKFISPNKKMWEQYSHTSLSVRQQECDSAVESLG